MPSIVEPDLSVGIPAGTPYPTAQVERTPGHGPCRRRGFARLFPPCNLIRKLDAQPLVGINAQNPIGAGQFRGKILLSGVSGPFTFNDASAKRTSNLNRPVGAPGIDDNYLI